MRVFHFWTALFLCAALAPLTPAPAAADWAFECRTGRGGALLHAARSQLPGHWRHAPRVAVLLDTFGGVVGVAVGKVRLIHLFDAAGRGGYYDWTGRSPAESPLQRPVRRAPVSSRYGPRRHPVHGGRQFHRGVDFAAPAGAPVFAAAAGRVLKAGENPLNGRYLFLRHGGGLETRYLHLRAVSPGIAAGARVAQGEVVGAVGSSGRARGAHLHYEVVRNGRHQNPLTAAYAERGLDQESLRILRTRSSRWGALDACAERGRSELAPNGAQGLDGVRLGGAS